MIDTSGRSRTRSAGPSAATAAEAELGTAGFETRRFNSALLAEPGRVLTRQGQHWRPGEAGAQADEGRGFVTQVRWPGESLQPVRLPERAANKNRGILGRE